MRLPPEDEEAFRRAVAGAEPLAKPRRQDLPRARPAPLARQHGGVDEGSQTTICHAMAELASGI